MKTTVELNKKDMEKIIAKEYNTAPENVCVTTENECIGYGHDEHIEKVPVCYIEIKTKEK